MSQVSRKHPFLPFCHGVAQKQAPWLGMLLALAYPVASAAVPDNANCNQLGREIALRAAEEMNLAFDSAARAQLASIAESACVSYTLSNSDAPAASAAVENRAAEEEDKGNGFFDIELIAPEDRVRRAGLKRR